LSTTITGTIRNIVTATVGSASNSFVRFVLRGTGGNQPRVTGSASIAPLQGGAGLFYSDIFADASGNVSGTVYSTRDAAGTGNGEIELGGSYTAAYFDMYVYANGVPGPAIPVHTKNTATLDISNVTPNTTTPVVTAPTGDTTYARLDAGNQPFTGSVTISKTGGLPILRVYGTGTSQFNGGTISLQSDASTANQARTWIQHIISDAGGQFGEAVFQQRSSGDVFISNWMLMDYNTATLTLNPGTGGVDFSSSKVKNANLAGASNGNAVTLLNAQNNLGAVTGTGADANLFTYTLPANTLATGKGLRITVGFNHSTGTAAVTYKFKIGSTTFSSSGANAATGQWFYTVTIYNQGSALASKLDYYIQGTSLPVTPAYNSGLAADFTSGQALAMTFSVAATDQVTPNMWMVELIQ
jgi:hypothetical protein